MESGFMGHMLVKTGSESGFSFDVIGVGRGGGYRRRRASRTQAPHLGPTIPEIKPSNCRLAIASRYRHGVPISGQIMVLSAHFKPFYLPLLVTLSPCIELFNIV